MNNKKTNKGSKGGLLEGPSHDNGGIPVVVKSTGEPIEVEGGEIIINKKASELHCEELSKINQSAGNGIAIPCESSSWNTQTAKLGTKVSTKKKQFIGVPEIRGYNFMWYEQKSQYDNSKPKLVKYSDRNKPEPKAKPKKVIREEGIDYFKGEMSNDKWIDALLYKNKYGEIIGILNHYPFDFEPYEKKGNINVMVAPHEQGKGIGLKLIKEALKRYPDIDLYQQHWTPQGQSLLRKIGADSNYYKFFQEYQTDLIDSKIKKYTKKLKSLDLDQSDIDNSTYDDKKDIITFVTEFNGMTQSRKITGTELMACKNSMDFLKKAKLVKKAEHGIHTPVGLTKEQQETYSKWHSLVNMTEDQLEKFYNSELGKTAGLTEAQAKANQIHSGRESARWLLKMIPLEPQKWTLLMWKWANKQISFISRMSGVKGPLYDANGQPSRKLLALLIWGHNPEKKNVGGKLGNETQLNFDFDDAVMKVEQKYVDEAERIITMSEGPNALPTRLALINWIKNPVNNVKVVIAFSGGKDSIAMVLYCLYDLELPKEQIELWHHDVDGHGEELFDWACTPSYCQAFADQFELPILFSYRNGGIARSIQKQNETDQPIYFQSEAGGEFHVYNPQRGTKNAPDKFLNTRNKFPNKVGKLATRWCSSNVKIEVMARAINHISRFDKGNFVIMTGERRLESTTRANYNAIEPYNNMSKNRRAITWRPIIDLSINEVWAMLEKYKIQAHPCYELGWGRCSCQLCIFNDSDTFATINEMNPEKINRISELEKQNAERGSTQPTLHASDKQAIGIKEWINKNNGKSFFNRETDEKWLKIANSTFNLPIIVENWTLPKGAFTKKEQGAN